MTRCSFYASRQVMPALSASILLYVTCCLFYPVSSADEHATLVPCSEDLKIHQFSFGAMGNYQYLIQSGMRAVTVDAAWNISGILHYAKELGLELVGALYTHHHADHVGGRFNSRASDPTITGALDIAASKVPLWIGAVDLKQASSTSGVALAKWTALSEGEVLRPFPGSQVEVVALDTPGHTAGGISFLTRSLQLDDAKSSCQEGVLFTGDTLFADYVGRTDLPGSDKDTLLRSLSRLAELPASTVVLPGHGYGPRPQSTVRQELKTNSVLRQARKRYPASSLAPLPVAARGSREEL
eukprot:TRINITY_DN60080_c0_g1_i1.p1 TRINITY_DN60080_c0_g1~~TRINITY_DN60080_c0_g1_i1.p1  ORF type:complete len:298 (-),score=36.98 TRINITY_DN60080_c0_g1_i1:51-944(-)